MAGAGRGAGAAEEGRGGLRIPIPRIRRSANREAGENLLPESRRVFNLLIGFCGMKCGPGRWRPAGAPRNATRGAGQPESSSRTTLLDTQRPAARPRAPNADERLRAPQPPGLPSPARSPVPARDHRRSLARRPLGTPARGTPRAGWPRRGPRARGAQPRGPAREGRIRGPPAAEPREVGAPLPAPPFSGLKPSRPPAAPSTPFLFCCDKKPLFSFPTQCVLTPWKCFSTNTCC